MACCGCTKSIKACRTIIVGSDEQLIQKTNTSVQVGGNVDQVHVFAGDPPEPISVILPSCPTIGDSILVVNCDALMSVTSEGPGIVGGDVPVAAGTSNLFTFAACCMWVPLVRPVLL